jgi:hypothetical protein
MRIGLIEKNAYYCYVDYFSWKPAAVKSIMGNVAIT